MVVAGLRSDLSDGWVDVGPADAPGLDMPASEAASTNDVLSGPAARAASNSHNSMRESSRQMIRSVASAPDLGTVGAKELETRLDADLLAFVHAKRVVSPENAKAEIEAVEREFNDASTHAEIKIAAKLSRGENVTANGEAVNDVKKFLRDLRNRMRTYFSTLKTYLRTPHAIDPPKKNSILASPWVVAPLAALGTITVLVIIGLIADANRKPKVLLMQRQQPMPQPPAVLPVFFQQPQPVVHAAPVAAPPQPLPAPSTPRQNAPPIVLMFPNINTNSKNNQN